MAALGGEVALWSPIGDDEIAACAESGVEYFEFEVAYDGMAVVVNPENDQTLPEKISLAATHYFAFQHTRWFET